MGDTHTFCYMGGVKSLNDTRGLTLPTSGGSQMGFASGICLG